MNSSKNQNDLSMGLNDQISFLEPKLAMTPRDEREAGIERHQNLKKA